MLDTKLYSAERLIWNEHVAWQKCMTNVLCWSFLNWTISNVSKDLTHLFRLYLSKHAMGLIYLPKFHLSVSFLGLQQIVKTLAYAYVTRLKQILQQQCQHRCYKNIYFFFLNDKYFFTSVKKKSCPISYNH